MTSATERRLQAALDGMREALADYFHPDTFGQAEDQLKGPIQSFMRAVGKAYDAGVRLHSEHRIAELGVRPDLRVEVNRALAGYIELKAPGRLVTPHAFKGREAGQWKKLQNLPNLIYTDSRTWLLYRTGTQRGTAVRIGDLAAGELPQTADARRLFALLHDFLTWQPSTPNSLRALADILAPLCRLLRQDVLDALLRPESALVQLAKEWKHYLFADADDAQFADAYAQTLTYAMLLARLEGAGSLYADAADVLDRQHGLLAQVLRVLGQPQARREIEVPVTLLEQSIEAIDPRRLAGRHAEPWLYFYETFLASYDSRLRRERGVYYTPAEVVDAQTSLVAELLKERFGKRFSFVDDDVTVLDPAVGTGTYLLNALQIGLTQVRAHYGFGNEAHRATTAARNFHGFEILVGPYAVAQLRLAQQIIDLGGGIPDDGLGIYLTDTLESPWKLPTGQLSLLHQRLVEENRRARDVKARTRVLVCIGNPPYRRETGKQLDASGARIGNWVRDGDDGRGGILDDFVEPLRQAGLGVHAKNLYNSYVYFWRWALWKVLDSTGGPGIVSFITASSYLRGPGFAGMRKVMRQTFDRIWILDLEGDTLGSRKTDNVFATKTPVAIAIGVRYGVPRETTPALVRYARVQGTRPEKLRALKSIRQFDDVQWQACGSEWLGPFSPRTTGRYFDWPPLTDLFPWQHSGVQFKRAWPIAPSREQLQKRWKRFLDHPPDERAKIFRETPDRKIGKSYTDLGGSTRLPPLHEVDRGTRPPPMLRYAFRSFDRQWALLDNRLADRPRPALWRLHSDEQLYLTSMLSGAVGPGPGATVAADVPDLHHFRGSYGGADVVPLWRDSTTSHPNVTRGLLGLLSERTGLQVSARALFAYCYGILTSPSYFRLFAEELTASGPRIPLTTDTNLFLATVSLGRHLVWLHTYGERWKPSGASGQAIPQGSARCCRHISTRRYPYTFSYDQERRALVIDEGEFSPVIPEVWDYCVSGLRIVDSWLGHRMAFPTGRRSSILDDIHPDHWTATLNEELLQLLWLLEGTIQLRSTLEDNLDRILSSNLLAAGDLPRPAAGERRPPPRSSTAFQAAMLSDDGPGPADWPA